MGVSEPPAGGEELRDETEEGAVCRDQQEAGNPPDRQPPPVCRRGRSDVYPSHTHKLSL